MGNKLEISFKIILLLFLQFLIDNLYVFIYETVNPIRATLIGATALVLLSVQYFAHSRFINPVIGALSIYSSALFGALLVQGNYLVSKSLFSALIHTIILIITYLILSYLNKKYLRKFSFF